MPDKLSKDVIDKANEKSVQIYYQQAVETFDFFSKKNENIRNKAGLLLTFLCGAVGFCVTVFVNQQQNYRYVFLISAILYYSISIFVCFKLFLTKASTSPYYPVQKQDDQKAIYESSTNDVLTTIVNENTKPAIEIALQSNNKLSKGFDFAVKLTLFVPLISIFIHIIIYYLLSFLSLADIVETVCVNEVSFLDGQVCSFLKAGFSQSAEKHTCVSLSVLSSQLTELLTDAPSYLKPF